MIAVIKMALSYHEYPEQFLSSLDNLDSLLARSNKAKYHDCVIV